MEHNERFGAAWWSGVVAKSDKTIPLKQLLIEGPFVPKPKMKWQAVKEALKVALPPTPSKLSAGSPRGGKRRRG